MFGDFDGERSDLVGVSADKALQGTRQIVILRLTDQLKQI